MLSEDPPPATHQQEYVVPGPHAIVHVLIARLVGGGLNMEGDGKIKHTHLCASAMVEVLRDIVSDLCDLWSLREHFVPEVHRAANFH